jgi:hypothetical protein
MITSGESFSIPGCDQLPVQLDGQSQRLIKIPVGNGCYDTASAKGRVQASVSVVSTQNKIKLSASSRDQLSIRLDGKSIGDIMVAGALGYDTTCPEGSIQAPIRVIADQCKCQGRLTHWTDRSVTGCDQFPVRLNDQGLCLISLPGLRGSDGRGHDAAYPKSRPISVPPCEKEREGTRKKRV